MRRRPSQIASTAALLLFAGCVFDAGGLGTEGVPGTGTSADASTTTGDAIDPSTLTPTSTGEATTTGEPATTTTGTPCPDGCPPVAGWTVVGEAGAGVGHAVVVDAHDDVIVAGDRIHDGDPTLHNLWVGTFAGADGAPGWETFHSGDAKRDDFARALALDESGQVVVAGASHVSEAGKLDVWVGWLAPNDGKILSTTNLGTTDWDDAAEARDERALALALAPDGTLLVGGSRCQRPCEVPGAWVGRYSLAGESLWQGPMLALGPGAVRGVAALGDGVVAVGTDGFDGGPAPWRTRIRRLDGGGSGQWSALPEAGPDAASYEALATAVGGDGLLWVVGRVFTGVADGTRGFVRVYDPLGDVAPLAEVEGDALAGSVTAVAIAADGTPRIAGGTGEHLWLAQLDPMLAEVWRLEAETPITARGLAIDGEGDTIVLGVLAATRVDGERLWLRKYVAAE